MTENTMTLPVYLDGHATSPLAPEAEAAMAPWWHHRAANAHSPHRRGTEAAAAVDQARVEVATLVGAAPQEIVFTSGATESNNMAILGVAEAAGRAGDMRREIIVSAIEHKSVLSAARSLEERGFSVQICPVGKDGRLDVIAFERMLSDQTLLVSVMAANNEIGTLQPIGAMLPMVRAVGAMIHVDAAQLAGKLVADVADYDYASISSHKMYGPMGVGAFFISAAAQYRPQPLFHGGTQEGGLRPGTLPTPLIVGFGAAARVAADRLERDGAHARALADRLVAGLEARQVRLRRNVASEHQLPGSLSLGLSGVDAPSLIDKLADTVCFSEGSACTSGQIQSSHVLGAMGFSDAERRETIRIYCGRYNDISQIDYAATAIADAVYGMTLAHWTDRPVRSSHEGRPHRF
ncbi:cysteine desulfurase family protein [Mesorhizobium sp. M0619]|uniref:cysteine desulfurase family protein n=1 Tax=unclassified Mesorhizobium TaxID=325217 RepID=UPI003335F15E